MFSNKCSIIAVTAILALSLCACGSSDTAEQPQEEAQQAETATANMTDDFSQGTKMWECDGLLFQVPSSWTSKAMDDGTGTFYYPPTGSGLNYLMVQAVGMSGSVQTEEVFDAFVEGIASSSENYVFVDKQPAKNQNGLSGMWYSYASTVQGYPVYCFSATFDSDSGATFFCMVEQQEWEYDYSNDLAKILDSVSVDNREQQETAQQEKEPAATTGQINALRKALSYLDYMSFSASGLADQLDYEGFSQDEIDYAVEHCGADWNEQAAKKAQSYMDYMSFSRSGLIDQLLFEGFTQEQAEYGAAAVGY